MGIEFVEAKRDAEGCWCHPTLEAFLDKNEREWIPSDEWKNWKDSVGIETHQVRMEDIDENSDLYIRYFEDEQTDISDWNPEPPSDDWHLLSIFDTEDGPICTFYRNKDKAGGE